MTPGPHRYGSDPPEKSVSLGGRFACAAIGEGKAEKDVLLGLPFSRAEGSQHMPLVISRMIVRSVSRMPSLARVPTFLMVFSTPLTTMPSPP